MNNWSVEFHWIYHLICVRIHKFGEKLNLIPCQQGTGNTATSLHQSAHSYHPVVQARRKDALVVPRYHRGMLSRLSPSLLPEDETKMNCI